jgi:multidrug efflux pump subunit AcrA (membrane-fusion protein)
MGLFRQEVVAEAKSKNFGEIVLLRRPSSYFYSCLCLLILTAIIVFFCSFDISRYASFTGVIVPEFGYTQVQAVGSGVVAKRLVNDGQHVNAGDELFVLTSAPAAPAAVPEYAESVRAPCAGIVSHTAAPGQRSAANQSLAMIAPDGMPLIAELQARNRTGATFKAGDKVVIRYPAFPFQKYGNFGGIVTGAPSGPQGRLHVRLDAAPANGSANNIVITPGLELEATIVWERRKLLQWVLDSINLNQKGDAGQGGRF